MARYRILYWHHIPSVVEAKDKEIVHKEQLSSRFQELIDRVAMKRKLSGTDAYLEGWRKGPSKVRDGEANEVARAIALELEDQYDEIADEDFN